MINNSYKKLIHGNFYEVYDTVATIITILSSESLYFIVFHISNEAFLEMFRCIELIRICINKQHISNSLPIIESVLSVFQCRLISPCTSTKFINDGFALMKRGGVIVNEFVEAVKKSKN